MKKMNRRVTHIALAAALGLTGMLTAASTAGATYHQNLIREIHETGTDGDYVVLQAYSAGQNLLAGKKVVPYDGGGNPMPSVTLANVPNGANQATVLVGDAGVPGADATDPTFNINNTGGTVCFTENDGVTGLDCIAYQNVGGIPASFPPVPPASPYGTPFSLGGLDFNGKSIVRTISRGCATALDASDDTNDSAADFAFGAPIARNNAAAPTETLCAPGTTTPAVCAGQTATAVGTNGADTLTGTPGVDVIAGFSGNDVIRGLAGKDIVCGGAGKDKLVGGKGKDKLLGEGGSDTLKGGPGKDKLKGGPGRDILKGGPGKDKLNGGAGKDVQIQ